MSKEKDRTSPPPYEPQSTASSPKVLRPALAPGKKHRSLSMNSNGSNHLAQQRSMSIILLELPRNSIISIDDTFLRPTRNNSTASLSSLGTAAVTSPSDQMPHNFTRHKAKSSKNSCAVMSDEDSELELHLTHGKVRWHRRSSDKVQKPPVLSNLKKDYKFKFDRHRPRVSSPSSALTPPDTAFLHPPPQAQPKFLDDPSPSPLSLTHEANSYLHSPHRIHNTDSDFGSLHPHELMYLHIPPAKSIQSSPTQSSEDELSYPHKLPSKKLRNSSISQSIFLKKRMLLLKDIQLELLESNNNPGMASTNVLNAADTKFPESLKPQSQELLDDGNVADHSSLPSPPVGVEPNIRRNRLITELNRKWNKAVLDFPDRTSRDSSTVSARKRERSELVSSTDSFAIH